MKKILTISLCLAALFFCHGQKDNAVYEYRHMTGNLGPHELIFDLMRSGNEISGKAYSPGRSDKNSNAGEDTFVFRLRGVIDDYGIAELEAFEADHLAGTFSGPLGMQYKGTFRPEGNDMPRSFLLEDDYSESVAFDAFHIERDSSLIDSVGSPGARISISILLPRDADTLFFIREAVLEAFFGTQALGACSDEAILPAYADLYFSKYIESNIDIYDGGYSFNWQMEGSAHINLNRAGLLVFGTENYGYSGGAHGMGVSRFLVFDIKNKTQLGLEDIFVNDFEKELSVLLELQYREQMFLGQEESLTDNGLFEEDIYPSENFWLTDESIGFYYNPYQLAPYSMGPISISLRKDKLQDLLKPDSPVKRLGW